jgi:quercetin dioxygenase-like cupin family protein
MSVHTTPRPDRPAVSDVEERDGERRFTLSFQPSQSLPNHRSPSRLVIAVVAGSGEITLADGGPRWMQAGLVFQVDPGIEHAIVAGPEGLELVVRLVGNCCEAC